MSELQPSTNANQFFSSKLIEMEKLSKSFHGVYIFNVATLLIVLGYILLALFIPVFDHPEQLTSIPGVSIILALGILIYVIWSLFVWFRLYIYVWRTPSSIVRDGGFGKAFAFLVVINIIISIALRCFAKSISEESISLIEFLNGFVGLAAAICFLTYLNHLAKAIKSTRLKKCVKWMVYGFILFFVLVVGGSILGHAVAREVGLIVMFLGLVFLLVSFIAWLNSFNYASKDIMTYIQNQCHKNDNAPDACQQPDQGQF